MRELRRVSALPGYAWVLAGQGFLNVQYWDARKARGLWLAYLEELLAHPSLPVQFQARRAQLHLHDLYGTTTCNPLPAQKADCARFLDWFAVEAVQRECAAGRIKWSALEFWRTFWHAGVEAEERHWEAVIPPRLRRIVPESE